MGYNVKVICNAGLNYISYTGALNYVMRAKELGADAIKFHITDIDKTWKYDKKENELSRIKYQNIDVHNYIESLQLSELEWLEIKRLCDLIGIEFMACTDSKDKMKLLIIMGVKTLCLNNEFSNDIISKCYTKKFDNIFIHSGAIKSNKANFYSIGLYPCDRENVSFTNMSKYIGFYDTTIEYNKEWCDKIKSKLNIKYIEKQFKLSDDCIDNHFSLGYQEMKEFIENIKTDGSVYENVKVIISSMG